MTKEKIYLGTYTKRKSKGIYSVELNKKNQKLENLELVTEIESPTYISVDENKIFALTNQNKLGGISFIKDNKIKSIFTSELATPCYIEKIENNLILTANYHTGETSIYKLENEEIQLIEKYKYEKNEVEKTNAHFITTTPDKKFIVVCYLGSDEIISYKIENDKLVKNNTYSTQKGSGPRHLVFNKSGDIAYLICELDATVEVLKYEKNNGNFSLLQKISILENDNQKKWASAIKITKDNKFLYTSNRGDDLITCFKILENNKLEKIQTIKTNGNVARDFTLDSSEKFLVVGHQESDNLSLFKRNIDGSLTFLNNDFFAPEVVCLKTK